MASVPLIELGLSKRHPPACSLRSSVAAQSWSVFVPRVSLPCSVALLRSGLQCLQPCLSRGGSPQEQRAALTHAGDWCSKELSAFTLWSAAESEISSHQHYCPGAVLLGSSPGLTGSPAGTQAAFQLELPLSALTGIAVGKPTAAKLDNAVAGPQRASHHRRVPVTALFSRARWFSLC